MLLLLVLLGAEVEMLVVEVERLRVVQLEVRLEVRPEKRQVVRVVPLLEVQPAGVSQVLLQKWVLERVP